MSPGPGYVDSTKIYSSWQSGSYDQSSDVDWMARWAPTTVNAVDGADDYSADREQ
jgi:hypothetical protein